MKPKELFIRIVSNTMKGVKQFDAIWLFAGANIFGCFNFCRPRNNFVHVFWGCRRGHW